jgi:hypothetical protein
LDAITYLQHQFANLDRIFHSIVADFRPEELTIRPAPSQNLIGYTVWHIPRTQDAHVHTWIRGVPEVAHRHRRMSFQDLKRFGYGVGILLEEADEIARIVEISEILEYADEVHHDITHWLNSLDESDLDLTPDIPSHLSKHPEYQRPSFLREVEDLLDQPIWTQLMRPCIGHIHRHLGELEIVKTIIRTHQGA